MWALMQWFGWAGIKQQIPANWCATAALHGTHPRVSGWVPECRRAGCARARGLLRRRTAAATHICTRHASTSAAPMDPPTHNVPTATHTHARSACISKARTRMQCCVTNPTGAMGPHAFAPGRQSPLEARAHVVTAVAAGDAHEGAGAKRMHNGHANPGGAAWLYVHLHRDVRDRRATAVRPCVDAQRRAVVLARWVV
jgi:hypothetical protein